MKAKVSWVEGMKFVGESESGHQVTLDGANPGEGASPMEMILLAVGVVVTGVFAQPLIHAVAVAAASVL